MFFSLKALKEWAVESADNDKRLKAGDQKAGLSTQ